MAPASLFGKGHRKMTTDDDGDYDDLLKLETLFLEKVNDDEIKNLYMSARRGGDAEYRALVTIAKDGWANPESAAPEMAKADRAIFLLHWFRMLTH